jgi:hypothetical protein
MSKNFDVKNEVIKFMVSVSFGLTQSSLVYKVLSLLEEGCNSFFYEILYLFTKLHGVISVLDSQ